MITNIQNRYNGILSAQKETERKLGKDTGAEFSGILGSAKELNKASNEADKEVEQLTTDFILGKTDNLHGLMIAQEKAGILNQFTVQVRNNVLDAYKEIMRLPV